MVATRGLSTIEATPSRDFQGQAVARQPWLAGLALGHLDAYDPAGMVGGVDLR
jgi:hypothetical protein